MDRSLLARLSAIPFRKPQLGRDYWILERALVNGDEIVERIHGRDDWLLGLPHRQETWPGMRVANALLAAEMDVVEAWVRKQTGAKRLWQEQAPDGAQLDHNVAQLVGARESGPRPHTDSRALCRWAAVLYLTPKPDARAGTSFYRLRLPGGRLGGNVCPAPHANLREAFGVQGLPLEAWHEELVVENVFNRLLLYRADLIHSASRYFGGAAPRSRRMTAVFFWMA